MKKLTITLVLLLCSSAFSEIPGRLDSLAARVKMQLVRSSTYANLPDAMIYSVINDAATEVGGWPSAVEKLDTIITHPDTVFYTPSSVVAHPMWAAEFTGSQSSTNTGVKVRALEPAPSIAAAQVYYARYINGLQDKLAKPDPSDPYYFGVTANKVWFYPQPAFYDTIIFAFEGNQGALNAVSDTLVIKQEYREALLNYALYKTCALVDNFGKAAQFYQSYLRKKVEVEGQVGEIAQ